jgi:hypothetical protein
MRKRLRGHTVVNEGGGKVVKTGAAVAHASEKPAVSVAEANRVLADLKAKAGAYDPDADYVLKTVRAEDYYSRFRIPMKHTTAGEGSATVESETAISGVLALPTGPAGALRARPFSGWKQLGRIAETQEYKAMRLRETHGVRIPRNRLTESFPGAKSLRELRESDDFATDGTGGGTSPFSTSQPNNEFHPLLLGPFNRNQYLHDFLDMASKSFEAYHHNPILKSAINLICAFTLGDGIKVKFSSPLCQRVWDDWVEQVGMTGTTYQDRLRMLYRDACVIGEVFLYSPLTMGGPAFKLWDASTVWEIVTNPRDIDEVFYAYRQFPTQYQLPYTAPGSSPVEVPPMSEYVIEQIPPVDWLQVKLNATVGEKRGRSDLFSVLGWGKRFKDWFDAAIVNAQINNAFVMWWQVNGSQDDVDALKNNADFTRVPPPGSALFTNMAATPSLMRAQGGTAGTGQGEIGEQLLSVIATSLNLPPEYLGVTGSGPRATALTRSEPAAKFFEQRQQLVREVVSYQIKRLMTFAKARGMLPVLQPRKAAVSKLLSLIHAGRLERAAAEIEALRTAGSLQDPLDEAFEVIMPKIQPDDVSTDLKDLAVLRTTKVISQETYSGMAAELKDIRNYDFNAEQEKMADEAERGVLGLDSMPAGLFPTPGENGKKPGGREDDEAYRARTKEKPEP